MSRQPTPVYEAIAKASIAGALVTSVSHDTVIDKFGVGFGAEYHTDGDNHFVVTTDVAVSDQFYAWVCGFGTKAKIVEPEQVATDFRKYLSTVLNQY